jgi:predicted dehydrogenase
MDRLRVGIAGYGIVGRRRRACVERNAHMDLVAVCDRTFECAGTMTDGVRFYKNYPQLLQEKLDILVVCLTNDVASPATIAALQRGLHVFCEKPPGRNMHDIAEVVRVEKSHPSAKLMYGFNHRYHESVRDALKLTGAGRMGRIINMRGVYGKSKMITFNQSDWRTKREIAGGGVLLDQGIHMVDLMRLFAGEFVEVQSVISNGYWGFDVEDNAYALMRTADGIVGMLNSSATQWRHRFNLDINLERGSIILGGILSGSKSYGAETMTVVMADPDNDNGDPREQITRYNRDTSWDDEIDIFVDCIVQNRPIQQSSSRDAFETMKLVYRIYHGDPAWRARFAIPDPETYRYE